MNDWCILRCAASRTLPVAAALTAAGFQSWTPVQTLEIRCDKKRTRELKALAILPTFVFSAWSRLSELRQIAKSPNQCFQVWDSDERRMVTKGIPFFSVFSFDGMIPRIADRALQPLRAFERQSLPRVPATIFAVGQAVRVDGAGFEGLVAMVAGTRGGQVCVEFPGFPVPVLVDPRRLALAELEAA